jgi:CRP/FNR family cyclic AMP-dependent transcriptional regulator
MNPANLFKHEPDPIQLAAGEILFREGELGDCMYVLLEGKMNVVVAGEVVEQSEPGALLGEMALIDDSPRVATVLASEASRLAKVDQRRFNFIIQQNPFFAKHVMRELVERLRRMNRVHAAIKSGPDAAPQA